MKTALIKFRNHRGLALITVVTLLALATVLLLALFSTTQTEMAATSSYADGASARQHADMAVNLVVGQLQKATRQDANAGGREIWASQPGMVRQYRENGRLLRGYKLYSSNEMVVAAAGDSDAADVQALRAIANDVPAVDWDESPQRWVDLNEPVWRETGTGGVRKLIFPIIDPRAYVGTDNPPNINASARSRSVEGFHYVRSNKGGNSGPAGEAIRGVVHAAVQGTPDDKQRLPMPVQWLYVLQDGALGYLNEAGVFVGAGGEAATRDNPIVSRIAFWADDETSKININTAGEGTAWNTPWLFHERDGDWARFQPMMYEYQRYPGHPATVAMSTVLFPNVPMNPPRTVGSSDVPTADFNQALAIKETLYGLMPKIVPGGSRAGSVAVPPGRTFTPTDFARVQEAAADRLFASVDEFLLRPQVGPGGEREEIDLGVSSLWGGMALPDVVERLNFFLTPNSHAPETNPFGMPKIAMWPLHDSHDAGEEERYRTVFDRLIARASTIAGQEYYFRRRHSNSQGELDDIVRNNRLFNMLRAMTSSPIPGFGEGGATFAAKYGDNRDQILVEIFDYIRSTNLYDDVLAEQALGPIESPPITGAPDGRVTAYNTNGGLKTNTFTPMRSAKNSGNVGAVSMGSWPGHGQVVPTVRDIGGKTFRGMGRFATISEAGLLFICCAEGSDRAGGGSALKRSVASGDFEPVPVASGYTPANYNAEPYDNAPRWYSNFPPLGTANRNADNNFYGKEYPNGRDVPEFMGPGFNGTNPAHPGYRPAYWNWCLEQDKPLPANTKRLQATFLLEWFIPSAGWTLINPDFEIEVDARTLSVGGKPMFTRNGGVITVKPRNQMNSPYEIYQRGGTTSYRGFLAGRKLPSIGNMPADAGYTTTSFGGTVIENSHRYDLVSDYFDVPSSGPVPFDGGRVVVRIKKTNGELLQTIHLQFPASGFPAPDLVDFTQAPSASQNANGTWSITRQVPPPAWWAFHVDGAIGRRADGVFEGGDELRGRMSSPGDTTQFDPLNGGSTRGNVAFYRNSGGTVRSDTLRSLMIRHGDPRLVMGQAEVSDNVFVPNRFYHDINERRAHRMVLANQNAGPGMDYGYDLPATSRFIPGATYPDKWLPDIPLGSSFNTTAQGDIRRYGDFDSGIANMEDGAYINKPDEGNTLNTYVNDSKTEESVPYFSHTWISWSGGSTYFSPNRQVSSPGMFGSLPTGVHAGGGGLGTQEQGWRSLMFRPQVYQSANAASGAAPHPGAPATLKWTNASGNVQKFPNGGVDPPDYLWMDFFWMPVVEPYAISEPGATAGKINLNYQMAPFRHIRRATGLYAAMKSEFIHALPHADTDKYLSRPGSAPPGRGESWFRKNSDGHYWHREIDVDTTLRLFDERFVSGFGFISPAQICEMFLLPKRGQGGPGDSLVPQAGWRTTFQDNRSITDSRSMSRFWDRHAPTSDNMKERPYANLYPKLTTRSNTFRVHVRAQTLRKARSSDPARFEEGVDSVTGEYRGSAVVERYLDENALLALPVNSGRDYTAGSAGEMMNVNTRRPLDAYHRFRVVSQKSFD